MSTLAHRGTHCGCANCLAGQREKMIDRLTRDSLHIAVRHAQEQSESWAAFEARPSGFPTLPTNLPGTSFTLQWTEPVRIQPLPTDRGVALPAGLPARFATLYDQAAPNLIYAVVRKGAKYPLYVGHVARAGRTMRIRLGEHKKGKKSSHWSSGSAQLTAMLGSSTDLYLVLGTYAPPPAPYRANPNMTRVIEGLVQEITRPRMWTDKTTSFELEERDEAELADLLEGEV